MDSRVGDLYFLPGNAYYVFLRIASLALFRVWERSVRRGASERWRQATRKVIVND